MSDDIPDWEAKYWANRQQQLNQQKQNSQVQQTPTYQTPGLHPSQGYPDIDPMAMVQRRMFDGFINGQSANQRSVFLREGAEYYRNLQGGDGFGNTIPLVRSMGKLSGVAGKEFVVEGETRGILIDGLSQVDFSKINEESERFGMYVVVKAPFAGKILVRQNAIIEIKGTSRSGILKG